MQNLCSNENKNKLGKYYIFSIFENFDFADNKIQANNYRKLEKEYRDNYYDTLYSNKNKKPKTTITYSNLYEKLIFKASHLLGVPVNQIAIIYGSYCAENYFTYNDNGIEMFPGFHCTSQVYSASIIPILNQDTILIPEGKFCVKQDLSRFSDTIYTYLHNKYQNKTVNLIDKTDSYVQIEVNNLRNEIVEGSKLWEKLQISFILNEEQDGEFNVRIITDGQYASGIRKPKANNLYYDMESKYSQELGIYTRRLLTGLKEYTEKVSLKENERV